MPGQDKDEENQNNMNGQDEKQQTKKIKEILKSGLEDLVNVNSLLSIAVFVGLTYATPGQRSLENRPECDAELRHAKNLVIRLGRLSCKSPYTQGATLLMTAIVCVEGEAAGDIHR
ncbi:hypothetical protein LOK49_LG15G00975 [Camellia lanceoleosa]|uniref:Uncharacterized protein n=1 Tax=Camellia lanceoleosa TaxID=1840588 RepID=A0ACC0F229_9ERIC|nr:hypothetical protein LOK49_LG15G00975 [Camellia lanceoleosa]